MSLSTLPLSLRFVKYSLLCSLDFGPLLHFPINIGNSRLRPCLILSQIKMQFFHSSFYMYLGGWMHRAPVPLVAILRPHCMTLAVFPSRGLILTQSILQCCKSYLWRIQVCFPIRSVRSALHTLRKTCISGWRPDYYNNAVAGIFPDGSDRPWSWPTWPRYCSRPDSSHISFRMSVFKSIYVKPTAHSSFIVVS